MEDEERRARLEDAARLYDRAAEELERGAAHARRAAVHFRGGEVPRGAAHAWATRGHVLAAGQALDEQALQHRLRALSSPAIEHVALWTDDLERLREWYEHWFGARAGELYTNESTGFSSYFLEFDGGPRLELMRMPGQETGLRAHLAVSLDSKERVDELAGLIGAVEGPRTTGDGYYEAVVLDPDGNRVELAVSRKVSDTFKSG
jgi:lactoylglutathione lyase